jgi:N-acetylneuraminate synthase
MLNLDALFSPTIAGEVTPPTYVIAEAGVNHNGEMTMAKALVDGAKAAGADAVKFQLFDPATLASSQATLANYQANNTGGKINDSQQAMLEKLAFGIDQFLELSAYCRQQGIQFLCSPFDETSARQLVTELDVPLLKIPSGELTNLPYLETLSLLGVPLILSTGMATLDEVTEAVKTIHHGGNPPLAILHCVSAYPATDDTINLRAMATMASTFPQHPIGYSDHTLGWHIPSAAVAMGARIIEKHLTLDTSLPGPDHKASLTVQDFTAMMAAIRGIEAAMGHGTKTPHPSEADCRNVARKSLVFAADLPAGHRLTKADIAIKRPGTGILPKHLKNVIGQTLTQPVTADSLIDERVLSTPVNA